MAYESARFYYRADTLTARFSRSGAEFSAPYPLKVGMTADAAAIGGNALRLNANSNNQGGIIFPGLLNYSDTVAVSFVMRFRSSSAAGVSATAANLFFSAAGAGGAYNISLAENTNGSARIQISNNGGSQFTSDIGAALAITTTAYCDLVLTYTGFTGTGANNLYVDNVLIGTTGTTAFDFCATPATNGTFTSNNITGIYIGRTASQFMNGWGQFHLSEFAIFNKVLSAATINAMQLVSTGGVTSTGALNGSGRSSWMDIPKFNGQEWTSLPASQIQSGVNQVQAGLTQTGTDIGNNFWNTSTASELKHDISKLQGGVTITGSYRAYDLWTSLAASSIVSPAGNTQDGVSITGSYVPPVWTSLAANEIKNGTNQIQNGLTQTGNFSGETWSTLAASAIVQGYNQIQNSVTITGTALVPLASSGTAGTVDIGNIKEQIRYVLYVNNTTTGAPVTDLSGGLVSRVPDHGIMTLNPELIRPLQTNFPYITLFLSKKDIVQKTIAVNQVQGKREANLTFTIVAATFLMHNSTHTADTSQADLELLMENAERILRGYPDLGGYSRWQFPTGISYHSATYAEETHLRIGVMDLSCRVYY